MRLLYDARLASRGLGISTFVVQLAQALATNDDVELVWFGDPALAPPGTRSALNACRAPYLLLDGPAGRALARRLEVDLVHFTGNTGWGRSGPVPSVLTLHDLMFLDSGMRSRSLRQIIGHRYERRQLPHAVVAADVLVVPSRTVAADVESRGLSRRPPSVIHLGVEQPAQPPLADGGDRHLRPHVPAVPPYVVAFAGRDPRKLTVEVVQAWRQLSETPLRLQLLAAGGMPPGLRRALAHELAAGAVKLHGQLPRAQVWTLLAGALALIYPSRNEGFGLPVLEGLAAGVPVLSGIAPATREIGGDAIIQLDPADVVGSIAAGLRRLLADPSEGAGARARGQARVKQFTWQQTASRYLRAYREAVEGRR